MPSPGTPRHPPRDGIRVSSAHDGFEIVGGTSADPFGSRAQPAYRAERAIWQDVLGRELWFHFGVYSPMGTNTLDAVGARYFEQQLAVAGIEPDSRVERVLDVGFGWGATLLHLARRHPRCARIDGINASESQIRFAATRVRAGRVADRVHLYLGDAQDLYLIPDPQPRYDVVVLRGSVGNLTPNTLDATLRAIAERTALGARMLISETCLTTSAGRLAHPHRTTVSELAGLLERHSFAVLDLRELPGVDDATAWLDAVRANIEARVPEPQVPSIAALRDVADNLSMALHAGLAGVYSVVARRVPERPGRGGWPARSQSA